MSKDDSPKFCKQDLHQLAVLKALKIIGEARECQKPRGSSISVRAKEIRATDPGAEGVCFRAIETALLGGRLAYAFWCFLGLLDANNVPPPRGDRWTRMALQRVRQRLGLC